MEEVEEEVKRLERLIAEDNVEELSTILNSNEYLRNNFNTFNTLLDPEDEFTEFPLLLLAVKLQSKKVVEYLLSREFVDKTIRDNSGENIYHVVCSIRGAEDLFSIIERNVDHKLIFDKSHHHFSLLSIYQFTAFDFAIKESNLFVVKRLFEICSELSMKAPKKNSLFRKVLYNKDFEVLKYISSFDGVILDDKTLLEAIGGLPLDFVIYLLNFYLRQNTPSHLRNEIDIFQFSNINYFNNTLENNNLNIKNENNMIKNDNIDNNNNNDNNLELFERIFQKIIDLKVVKTDNRIWQEVCKNGNLDVVQFIFSLKGIQPEILFKNENNSFLIACDENSNIQVIKYLHNRFPSFINSVDQINGAYFVLGNGRLNLSDKGKILHYLYLNGIDIHFISKEISEYDGETTYHSIYTKCNENEWYEVDENILNYLKVISQDFDYLHHEHDHTTYKKPSFWKEFDSNNNNNNNNNNRDGQSMRVNEWKNRFEEHVLCKLSKMIQQHMLLVPYKHS